MEQVRYAGFWVRVVAAILDSIVLSFIGFLVGLFISSYFWQQIFGIILGLVYCTFYESSPCQATLGKRAMGLVVVDKECARVSQTTALCRYVSKILSAVVLMLGYIMVAFTAKKQGLHDKIAGTYVIYRNN